MEFPVSREARVRYALEVGLLSPRGTAVFETVQAARDLAARLNRVRELARHPAGAIRTGQLNALGLIEEILRHVISVYRQTRNPNALTGAVAWLNERTGREAVELAHRVFAEEFPPPPVFLGEAAAVFLEGETDGLSNRALVQEEMLLLWLANENPAYAQFLDLFDDAPLEARTGYPRLVQSVKEFFDAQPHFGPDDQNLVEMLRSPMLASPHSLYGQLEYIWARWGYLLGRYEHIYRLLRGLDLIREEDRLRFHGPGLSRPYDFTPMAAEAERFSPDQDWMPRLVLVAKNAHVWLEQLSRAYARRIARLDDIPDEELARLGRWGMTGLWLIGLWERSPASQRIKQMRGNTDAVASAYSLFEYEIAADLGGEAALRDLKDRAWRHGVRLASDMVPNHMGIDSPWVIDHPEWFLSLDHSPFPVYTFNGPDLSWNASVGIYLEDHYFDSTDAAVVFKRVDRRTGGERYVHHGNDGTSMPWNDTAQIDYLNPDAREAVIRTILHVAGLFPVIRFDAAMTLAKRHFQRLWYPEPGTGGAIPSRSERGLTKEQFDAAMPEEFWREVVDRVAREVPDTLLLAEAFWLMEGYFVRTLGMHRVYNSAFMNMLRDEDNANYRSVIKNTLEFDPEILKRYVNFMNNPDEKTAVEQFGKGDKYFGIATLMATLPGLPMFGHGQVEGFEEKYGMEFRRARRDETPDPELVARHEREICPLLHRRKLFAEVRNFLLYDVFAEDGSVNEDVFAYSNRDGGDRALIVYHNRFGSARGWIRTSVAFDPKSVGGRVLVQSTLGEGLGLGAGGAVRDTAGAAVQNAAGAAVRDTAGGAVQNTAGAAVQNAAGAAVRDTAGGAPRDGGDAAEGDLWVLFRDRTSGLEYVRSVREIHEQGLFVDLEAYGRRVFTDFREVRDDARGRYRALAAHLAGRGTPSLEEAWRELFLRPVHEALRALLSAAMVRRLMAAPARPRSGSEIETDFRVPDPSLEPVGPNASQGTSRTTHDHDRPVDAAVLHEVETKAARLAEELRAYTGGSGDPAALARLIRDSIAAALSLPAMVGELRVQGDRFGSDEEPPEIPAPIDVPEFPLVSSHERPGEQSRRSSPSGQDRARTPALLAPLEPGPSSWGTLFGWVVLHALGTVSGDSDAPAVSRRWLDELLLLRVLEETLVELGVDQDGVARSLALVRVLTERQTALSDPAPSPAAVRALVSALVRDDGVRRFLGVNRHENVLWYRKEAFEELLGWIGLAAAVTALASEETDSRAAGFERGGEKRPWSTLGAWSSRLVDLRSISDASGYRFELLQGTLVQES